MNSHPRDFAHASRSVHPWVIGGGLLVTSVLLDLILGQLSNVAGLSFIGTLVFAGGLAVFALARLDRHDGGDQRPTTVALFTLAGWLVVGEVVRLIALQAAPDAFGIVATTLSVVTFVLALAAAASFSRTSALETPWQWAPMWALAAVTVSWIFTQVVGLTGPVPPGLIIAIGVVVVLVSSAATTFLGVLAIALASRATATVTQPS